MLTLRRLAPDDDAAVHRIFRATLGLGSPLPFEPVAFDLYSRLCLGWYLGPGRARARAVVAEDRVVGYVLVGADPRGQRRWTASRAGAYAAAVATASLTRPRHDPGLTFGRLRVRDGWVARNGPAPMPVHAHMNLDPSVRITEAGRLMREHVDDVCWLLGAPGWYGEVNAPVGRRARALERVVGPVVHRAPNLTYSWLLGRPVERLTVVRFAGRASAIKTAS